MAETNSHGSGESRLGNRRAPDGATEGGADAVAARRSALRRQFDELRDVTSVDGLNPLRFPEIGGGTSDPVRLAAALNSMIDRLPEGDIQRAGRYLWSLDDESAQLTPATRRAAAAQTLSYSSWTALRDSGRYDDLRDQMVEIALGRADADRPRRRLFGVSRRSVPVLALLSVLAALLAIPSDGGVVVAGYRSVRSWFTDEAAEERAQDIEALESLATGMSRDHMVAALGEPTSERPVRGNPFGITKRTVFHHPAAYVVVALFNEAESAVYFSVTALSPDMKVQIPVPDNDAADGKARLGSTPISAIGCDSYVVGFFGASWSNFALLCGGSGADNFSMTVVGWNPYGDMDDVDDLVAATLAAMSPAVIENQAAKAECTESLGAVTERYGAAWAEDFRSACDFPNVWPSEAHEHLMSLPEWQRATRRIPVNTFAVTAPALVDADSLNLFLDVMNGPGPCRSELEGGSAGCASWY